VSARYLDCRSLMFLAANVTVTGADVLQPSKYASGLRYLILQTVEDMALEVSTYCLRNTLRKVGRLLVLRRNTSQRLCVQGDPNVDSCQARETAQAKVIRIVRRSRYDESGFQKV
jgi:hypothetical protein